jgi:hypothetical protein
VNTRTLLYRVAFIGLASAFLVAAGCGPTCPANEPNCGTSNGSIAGAAGTSSSGSGSCAALTALKSCMDGFCATQTNPFCTCYKRKLDLSTASCLCVDFDPKRFCDDQAASGITYDCSAATGAVATACVGVQQ